MQRLSLRWFCTRRFYTGLLAVPLWAASMFIHLFDSTVRTETIPVYVYGFYYWIPAVLREPSRFFSDYIWYVALIFFSIDLVHIGLCYAVSSLSLRLIFACTRRRGPSQTSNTPNC